MQKLRGVLKNGSRILKIIWPSSKWLIGGYFLVVLIGSALPFLSSAVRGLLINDLSSAVAGGNTENVYILIGITVFLIFLSSIVNDAEGTIQVLSGHRIEKAITEMELKKRMKIDCAQIEDPKLNDLFNKVNQKGVWSFQDFFARFFSTIRFGVRFILAALAITWASPWLLLLLMLSVIPEVIVDMRDANRAWGIHNAKAETTRKYWDLQSIFRHQIVEAKLFGALHYFYERMISLLDKFHKDDRDREIVNYRFKTFATLLTNSAMGVAMVWCALRVLEGDIMIGTFTFYIESIMNLRNSLSSTLFNVSRAMSVNLYVNDVFTMVDLPSTLPDTKHLPPIHKNGTPEIVFKNVSFAYPDTTRNVLENISITIKPGEKLAVVGLNGAGKTTFVKLLCRFYDPDKGHIALDGKDLREVNLNSWHQKMGVLFQNFNHYYLPVKEAIAAGQTGKAISLKKVKEAADRAQATGFIENMPQKFNTQLGKHYTGGVNLSGGEWQKIALARMFYRDPDIVILDEPTSAIDAQSEAAVFEHLEKVSEGKTVIFISHRFSTVRRAEKIAVIDKGKLAEYGTHEELIKLDKEYARLYNLQAKAFNE
ncbi:MAG: ABC transporter ATP-binding protein [Candidatus Vogelbacteria bacterium]|nr:ABC transporter ATP-binding protein [Candidatus Vogelbacteria bacterium]